MSEDEESNDGKEIEKQVLKFTLEIEGPEKGMWSIVIYDNYSPNIKDILVFKPDTKDINIKSYFTKIAQKINHKIFSINALQTHQINAKIEYTFRIDLSKIGDEMNKGRNDLN